mgnify:FL=1
MATPPHHEQKAQDILKKASSPPPFKVALEKIPDKFLLVAREDWRLGIYRTSLPKAVLWTTVPHSKVEVESVLTKVLPYL